MHPMYQDRFRLVDMYTSLMDSQHEVILNLFTKSTQLRVVRSGSRLLDRLSMLG